MIRHTVAFRLVHPAGSPEEADFLEEAKTLADIPGVQRFEALREVSPKNDFAFGLSMEFENQAAYDGYSNHPQHLSFVERRWSTEVADFQEVDYTAL